MPVSAQESFLRVSSRAFYFLFFHWSIQSSEGHLSVTMIDLIPAVSVHRCMLASDIYRAGISGGEKSE